MPQQFFSLFQSYWREAVRGRVVDSDDTADDTEDDAAFGANNDFGRLRHFLGQAGNHEKVGERGRVSKAEILLAILTFTLVFTLPQDALVELLKLMNIIFGVNFLPATRYLIDKMFMNREGMTYHACCPNCHRSGILTGDSLQKERKNQLSKLARTQEFDWRAERAAKQPRVSIITAQYSTVELHSLTAQNSEEQDSHLSKDDPSSTYVRPQPAPGHHRSWSADPGPETFFNTGGTKEISSTATKKSLPRSTSDWDLSGNRDSTREPSTYETVYPEDHSSQV
ncbi:hypothetical protein QAD02_021174 [Eretmocerus hayati]|uniref:Uncharacterized protein n=1 Tax=Eretmocerus hayati TaxID=131215 RepID=A0ACC2PQX1_9HYME|nr:hypothetical protein QAD02_021174 [Eretmocerus hayati]